MSSRAQAARGYRMRPAPRTRRGGRPASRIHWDKVGRVALVLVVAAVLVSYISPIVNFVDAWSDSRSEHAALADLKTENSKLRQRVAALDGEAAAERAARRVGMVAPGEAPYVLRGLGH